MDNLSLDTTDLDKLNDKDKTELRQFLQNENQKARVQASTLLPFPRLFHVPMGIHRHPKTNTFTCDVAFIVSLRIAVFLFVLPFASFSSSVYNR
jgi:hypothetical protein